VPILFENEDEQFISEPVRGHTYHVLNSEDSYAKLYAFLNGQAGVTPGELGLLMTLAHINHDLPQAIVASCESTATVPAHGTPQFQDCTSLNPTAWDNAELLWHLRRTPPLSAVFMDSLDGLTTVTNKALLVPVP
jgi:hypothetical protein